MLRQRVQSKTEEPSALRAAEAELKVSRPACGEGDVQSELACWLCQAHRRMQSLPPPTIFGQKSKEAVLNACRGNAVPALQEMEQQDDQLARAIRSTQQQASSLMERLGLSSKESKQAQEQARAEALALAEQRVREEAAAQQQQQLQQQQQQERGRGGGLFSRFFGGGQRSGSSSSSSSSNAAEALSTASVPVQQQQQAALQAMSSSQSQQQPQPQQEQGLTAATPPPDAGMGISEGAGIFFSTSLKFTGMAARVSERGGGLSKGGLE